MKRIVAVAVAGVATLAMIGTADAQFRRGWGRDRVVIERAAPVIGAGTLATILAIQALQQSQQNTTVVQERQVVREREVVPLK